MSLEHKKIAMNKMVKIKKKTIDTSKKTILWLFHHYGIYFYLFSSDTCDAWRR